MSGAPGLSLEALPVPAVVVDVAGRVVAANEAWRRDACPDDPSWRLRGVGERLVSPGDEGVASVGRALEDVLSGASRRAGATATVREAAGFEVHVGVVENGGERHALLMLTGREAAEFGGPDGGAPPAFRVDRALDGFFLADQGGRIQEVNRAVELLTGYSRAELLGRGLDELVPPADSAWFGGQLDALLGRSASALVDTALLRRDGSQVPVEISAQRLADGGVQGVVRDISSRKELEEQLRIAQRIESLGRLAGGIAHDFNNLITVISGHTDLLLATIPEGNLLREDLHEIRAASTRAASLTRQLLAFSRRQVFQLRNLDLNEVVAGTETMLRRIIGEDVELVFLPAGELGAMRGDPAQLEQVLMNLVVNARDAMPRGGELIIRTGNVELDAGFVRKNLGATVGRHVLLEVRDTGEGMAPAVAARVFEPFFTTKEPGKGTGLGLAMVYGIVKQSNGYIAVESEEGVGTAVRLYFPLVGGPAQEMGLEGDEAGGELATGSETILLVEDEEMVRSLARRILEGLGYRVLEAGDATEALDRAREAGNAVDLLLTDVVMPRISGRQLAEALTSEFPSLPVLFMSGYTDDALMHHGALAPGQGFLQKPFTPVSLSRKVREVLEGN
jgi:two-component system, cell cycle sensor histidine kinase and response regulator CckA